jgi:hypothetical protein
MPLVLSQVFPDRIEALNQPNLFRAAPAFQLLLAGDGLMYVIERLEVNQPMTAILLAEAFENMVLVLPDASIDVAAYADVEYA